MIRLPMLSRLDLRGSTGDLRDVLARDDAAASDDDALASVRAVIADVRSRGDAALRDLTERFDGCRIDDLRVPAREVAAALDGVPGEPRQALEYAARRDHGVSRGAVDPVGRPRPRRRRGSASWSCRSTAPAATCRVAVRRIRRAC